MQKKDRDAYLLYSNPSKGTVALELYRHGHEAATVRLYNLLGQTCFEKNVTFHQGANTIELQVESLSPGLYNLSVQTQRQTISKKFVKH